MIIVPGVNNGVPVEQPRRTFTGVVYSHPVFAAEGVKVATVTFTQCARTYWHHHEHGQILCVTSGIGRIATRGGSVHTIRTGDLIWTEPGEMHWHGANQDSVMSHLAISLGRTIWAEEVADPDTFEAIPLSRTRLGE